MADETLEPPGANVFDALVENDNISAAAPAAKPAANVFDQIGPDIAEGSSTTGAFGRAAARSTLPSIAAFPAMGAGAQAGAALGAFGGPAAPVTVPVGAIVGALVGGFGAGAAANAVQDWAISKLPDSWQEAIGQDDRQRKLDEQQHGTAAFMGGLLPTVLTMKPGLPAKMALRENATALERIMAYPATAAVFGGGVMGGMELAQEAQGDQPINWTHVAVATGVGVVFNRTTRLGERLIETGARPARRALGQPEPGEAGTAETPFDPAFRGYMTPEQAAGLERGDITPPRAETGTGFNVPEFPGSERDFAIPTVLQASDAKVIGPGVTESVFMGTQEQSPAAAMSAQQAVRNERLALGESPVPDINQVVKQMHPELFDTYKGALARLEDARRVMTENAETGVAPHMAAELKAAQAAVDELGPEVSAAYRRATEATGGEFVENVSRETMVSAPDLPQQRAFIAGDVERKLIAAGRPVEEAKASAQLIAARYETRAARFGGELGTAQELYLREGPEIVGPSGKVVKTAPDTGTMTPQELAEFVKKGGKVSAAKEPVQQETKSSKTAEQAWNEFQEQRQERNKRAEIATGFNDFRTRSGAAKLRGRASQAWEPGNTVDVGFVKDLLIVGKEPDGSFLLIAKPGKDGKSQSYTAKPQEGLLKDKSVDFLEATKPLAERELAQTPEGQEFEQSARGKVRISEGRKPIVTLMKDANASTFVHESGHIYLEELMRDAMHERAPAMLRDDADTVLGWLGAKSAEDIKTKHHEKFARGFEQYLREGVAPSKELAGVFARFKDWLVQIYESLKGLGAPINEDIKGVFDRMLAMEPQRTVIAAEREPGGPTIHDIHETEAREISTPEEAAPKADQVAAEANRYAAELTPEVKNELEAKIAQLETEIGELKGQPDAGAKPGGEAGAGAGEDGPLEPGSGKPGALNASLDGGAQPGAVGERGGGAAAESARPADVDTGNPLSPKPASLFGPEQSPFIDKAGNIRLDTLTNLEDVRTAIRDAAAANQDFIGDRRGVVTDGQVMDLARAAGMEGAERLVKNRVAGQAFSAEEVMTLRLALIQSATDVSGAMKKAANGTDADVMAYAAAKDKHNMLQATVAQATAEWGRAGRAFRNLTAGMTAEGKAADLIARQETGKTLFQLRQEARLGATLDTPEAVSKFMTDSRKRNFGHMMLEYWINGLLSGPATHVTNITGNLILTMQHMVPETALAAGIGAMQRALGREGEIVRFGEIAARFRGLAEALPSAVKAGAQSAAAGTGLRLPGEEARRLPFQTSDASMQPVLDEAATVSSVIADAYGAVQGIQDAMIATGALIKAGGEAGSPLIGTQYSMTGAIPDITVRGVNVLPVGTVARLPGRFLAAADGFFRALNYSMEKSARAYRIASEEGLTGTKFDARVADVRQNPTEAMMAEMAEESSKLTLMDRGGKFLTALERLSNVEVAGFPALKFIMPFVHVAGTIMRQAVMDRTPLGMLSAEIRADMMGKNGSVAQDMAMARMMFGTGLAVTVGMMAAQGQVAGSGPTDRNEAAMWKLAGNQAHSIRIGDMWYAVDKLGPTGMLMSIAADLYDVAKFAKEGELEEATAKTMQAFSQNIMDQSMMKGPSEMLRAVNDSDRYGSQYVRNFLSAFVPYSVGMSQLARSQDPHVMQARTVVDALRAKIPGHLDSYFENPLFPRRDIWGEPVVTPKKFGPTGIGVTALSTDPVNIALIELGVSPAPVSRKIRGVELTDPQFDDFARLAGRMTKQRLDVIVNSPDWRTWPNYAKTLVVEETVKQSREVARGLMMGKYPSIAKDATEAKLEKFRD